MLKHEIFLLLFDIFHFFINFVSYSSEDEDKPIENE